MGLGSLAATMKEKMNKIRQAFRNMVLEMEHLDRLKMSGEQLQLPWLDKCQCGWKILE